MLRNILGVTALTLAASVASAQQPTHKSSTIPASHPVPVVATQHARVPATVVTRKAAKTAAREERSETRAEERAEARAATHPDSLTANQAAHRASKAMKKHRGAKHATAKRAAASHDSSAKKQ